MFSQLAPQCLNFFIDMIGAWHRLENTLEGAAAQSLKFSFLEETTICIDNAIALS